MLPLMLTGCGVAVSDIARPSVATMSAPPPGAGST